jgi:hypothetical protein
MHIIFGFSENKIHGNFIKKTEEKESQTNKT